MRRHLFRAVIVAALLAVSVAGYSYSTYAKWSSSSATFYVNPSNADISSTSAIWALQYAMNVWSNAGSSFHFQYGGTASDNSSSYDNRNVILFRNQSNGSAIASTYSWWNSSNQLLDSDIIIWDGAFTFYAGTSGCGGISNSAYLEDIATHELGHALGLNHSNFSDATMYPSYSYCSQDMRTLSSDDVNGLKALYPGGSSSNTAPTVSISSPANGASYPAGTSISLVASAFDAQDGNLTSQITWTDNGSAIGSGGLVSSILNLVGVHVLVARVTDSGGLQGSSQVSITITVLPTNTPPSVSLTSPSSGASAVAPASFAVSANASDAQGAVASVAFWANSTMIGQDNSSPFSVSWSGVSAGTYTLLAVATDGGGLSTTSSPVQVTVTTAAAAAAPSGGNVAAASQGATITASSSYGSGYGPSALINGDRRGLNYGSGGVWHDSSSGSYPDWVEIAFAGSKSISQVAVFTVQDAWSAPSDPTPSMTWSQWGVNNFTVQYWTGSTWQTVPNGVVTQNNLVWRTISFPALTTTHIRVLSQWAQDGWSRFTEIEAYQSGSGGGGGGGSSSNSAPSVSITSPSSGTSAVAPASFTVAASAWDAEGAVSSVAFYANGSLIAQDNSSPFSMAWNNVTGGSYTLTAVATDAAGATATSSPVSVSVSGGGSTRVNVAASSQGGTATASSSYNSANYGAAAVINGDRRGANYGGGGVWHDATSGAYPDWVEIAFAGNRTIDEVDVFTVQDAWSAPSEPTPSMTWSRWGVNNFTVQYWTGSTWQTVPNGVVTENNLVWRSITFPALTTSRIRVLSHWAQDGWSRLTEIEAYQAQ